MYVLGREDGRRVDQPTRRHAGTGETTDQTKRRSEESADAVERR
jgi:hypothetical protein